MRPNLTCPEFIDRAKRQAQQFGYRMVYLEDAGSVKTVAGFVIREMLPLGRFLYVDDFVTDAPNRSRGYGRMLFDWLVAYARRQSCDQLHLDSRLDRTEARRFYERQGMHVSGYHFALRVKDEN